jgi:hypothetical protein
VDAVNADSVVDCLFAAKVLSDVDFHMLTDISERTTKTRKLLALLHLSRHPEAFIKLHEAIKTVAAYSWLAEKVDDLLTSSKGSSFDVSEHVEKGNKAIICENNFVHTKLLQVTVRLRNQNSYIAD